MDSAHITIFVDADTTALIRYEDGRTAVMGVTEVKELPNFVIRSFAVEVLDPDQLLEDEV